MPNNPESKAQQLTPEALERLEKAAMALSEAIKDDYRPRSNKEWDKFSAITCEFYEAADLPAILALLRSYREMESEHRIAMRALEMALDDVNDGKSKRDHAKLWLAEARA